VYLAQRDRLESSFAETRTLTLAHWRRHYCDHPLLGFLGRRLIWVFSNEHGWERSGLYSNGAVRDPHGELIDPTSATRVRLWHPLSSQRAELLQWRERVFTAAIRQPFRQAFREFYQVTEDERRTTNYSNRFAGLLMRQHQFSALCRARGWNYRLMGVGFDGFNVPTKILAPWNMHVEFYVDLPPDRDAPPRDSALDQRSASGINLFLSADQVRFYRNRREVAIDDVPAIVYSEVMRDVDLFTTLSAAGEDASWCDQGERGTGILASRPDVDELTSIVALRLDILSRVLPLTPIAGRCRIEKCWLEVRGQLGTYRIQVASGGVTRDTDSGPFQRLNIPHQLLEDVSADFSAFPIDLDHRTENILRKAYVLANDVQIDSPDLIRQL
jgi:hypothetical protein